LKSQRKTIKTLRLLSTNAWSGPNLSNETNL